MYFKKVSKKFDKFQKMFTNSIVLLLTGYSLYKVI